MYIALHKENLIQNKYVPMTLIFVKRYEDNTVLVFSLTDSGRLVYLCLEMMQIRFLLYLVWSDLFDLKISVTLSWSDNVVVERSMLNEEWL